MVLGGFRGGGDAQLEQIEAQIRQMLVDDRHTFDNAINALIGGTDPALVGKDIRKTDKGVNKAERAVLYRYFKRITAHLMNILTSLVMPIDRLDYYDETKADRE